MNIADRLSFGITSKLPMIYQRLPGECGLACLAMIAGYHGQHVSLDQLQSDVAESGKGVRLSTLLRAAETLGFAGRGVKLEKRDMRSLSVPCVLHWNNSHFVVLRRCTAKRFVIHDPASGPKTVPLDGAQNLFTGTALELSPAATFKTSERAPSITLRDLFGQVTGLWRSATQILFFVFALEVCALLMPLLLQWIIDRVIPSSDTRLLRTLGIGFSLLVLFQAGAGIARSWATMHMKTSLNLQWRANVFSHLLRLPLDYFGKRSLGDTISRVGAVDKIEAAISTTFIDGLFDGLMSIVILAILFIYSPPLAAIVLSAVIVAAMSQVAFLRSHMSAMRAEIVRGAAQQTFFIESIRAIRAIKLFRGASDRHARWLALLVNQLNASLHTQKLPILHGAVRSTVFGFEQVVVLWVGAYFVLNGVFSAGALVAFYTYRARLVARVPSLVDKILHLRMLSVEAERLGDIVLTSPERQDTPKSQSLHAIVPSIEVRKLCFRYGKDEDYVLKDVSFHVDAGESVAMIGPSGSGKTTLAHILIGVLPIQDGDVLFGGHSIRSIGLDTLRQLMGAVLQDDVLLAGSIKDNITFFESSPNRDWVEECARAAAIHDDVVEMPMRYETYIGEAGGLLSGGQKQRILLARALYKRPKILILDEATSHLDLERERQVEQAIHALSITRVIIAHRNETIRSVQRHVVLSKHRAERDMRAASGEAYSNVVVANRGSG